MPSPATTVNEYLNGLPADRRATLQTVRRVLRRHLDRGFQEGIQYGMIGYFVPHRVYPAGYHCDPRQPLPFAALASQKNYCSLYLMCLYMQGELLEWFRREWYASGKRLDMGKSCIRFQQADDLALDVIAQLLERVTAAKYIERYEQSLAEARPKRRSAPAAKQPVAARQRPATKKPAANKKAPAPKKSSAARQAARRK